MKEVKVKVSPFDKGGEEGMHVADNKKKSKATVKAILTRNAASWMETTTVHGFYYLPGPYPSSTNWFERCFWFLTIIVVFSIASVLIHVAFKDWNDHPTVTTTATYALSLIHI